MCDGDPCCRAVFVMGYYIFQKSAQLEVRKFHSVPGSADSVLSCAAPPNLDCSLPALPICLLWLPGSLTCTMTARCCGCCSSGQLPRRGPSLHNSGATTLLNPMKMPLAETTRLGTPLAEHT